MLYLDIMLHGRFLCQLPYPKRGFPQLVDGKIIEAYDYDDFLRFVYQQRPSLKGKNIEILPSLQRTTKK